MNWLRILSDQLYTWSASYDQQIDVRLAKAPSGPPPQTASACSHPSWLSHRTLQALWQAGLQVRQGPRSRSQVLPVGKLSPLAPADGLCAPGVSRPDQKVPGQLSACSRDLRGDLRDQSRATAPPRGALRCPDERTVFLAHRAHRSAIGRRSPRQYPRGLARRPTRLPDHRGGDR